MKDLVTLKSVSERQLFKGHSITYMTDKVETLDEAKDVIYDICRLLDKLNGKLVIDSETGKWSRESFLDEEFYKFYISREDLTEIKWFFTESVGRFNDGDKQLVKKKSEDMFKKLK